MNNFATALTLICSFAMAEPDETVGTYDPKTTDVSEYNVKWDKDGLSYLKKDGKRIDISSNLNTSAWTLDRWKMYGQFLKPQTPLDGCYARELIVEAEEEKGDWW